MDFSNLNDYDRKQMERLIEEKQVNYLSQYLYIHIVKIIEIEKKKKRKKLIEVVV